MTILVLDIGTTNSKAGLFSHTGTALHIATRPTPRIRTQDMTIIPPQALWETLCSAIEESMHVAHQPEIDAVGIASMAETGMLVDRRTGQPRSPLLPWYDNSAAPFARFLAEHDTVERFQSFGIHPSFKCSLAKILQLRQESPAITEQAVWLCAADYIAFRMTGIMATDFSLAGRTYAFDLRKLDWDRSFLEKLGLPNDLFPTAQASGTVIGQVTEPHMLALGLSRQTRVAICGHDHVCAAIAVGANNAERMLDSMGTAEALLGAMVIPAEQHIWQVKQPVLDQKAHHSGISFGIMPLSDHWYWIGGLSTSGGSLDWLRSMLGEPPLSYAALQVMLESLDSEPGKLLFLPFLVGSGPPAPNSTARGAFLGLSAEHSRADLLRAVLEGVAFQMESIRRTARHITGQNLMSIIAVGGGTRNQRWLQIKADIAGLPLSAMAHDEATLKGAAFLVGLGSGLYSSSADIMTIIEQQPGHTIEPDMQRHELYAERYNHFLEWQKIITTQSSR